MGCDIHFYVETKKSGKWESADTWEVDKDDDPPRARVPYEKAFYHDRNYNLFAILADVRNGYGFAGVDTGDGFKVISEPKGLPPDASPQIKAEAEAWNGDGHSHSFHTLQALLNFDWTQTSKLRGVVSAKEYWDWTRYRKGEGKGPESYCGDVMGRDIRKISVAQMDEFLAPLLKIGKYQEIEAAIARKGENLRVQVEWEEPYYRCARGFLGETIPRLLRLGKPEDVRIVFWFDN